MIYQASSTVEAYKRWFEL